MRIGTWTWAWPIGTTEIGCIGTGAGDGIPFQLAGGTEGRAVAGVALVALAAGVAGVAGVVDVAGCQPQETASRLRRRPNARPAHRLRPLHGPRRPPLSGRTPRAAGIRLTVSPPLPSQVAPVRHVLPWRNDLTLRGTRTVPFELRVGAFPHLPRLNTAQGMMG